MGKRQHNGIRAELWIYSGEDNPSWLLNKEQEEEVLRRLQNLRPSERTFPVKTGYSGFNLISPGPHPGSKTSIRVFDGLIALRENGKLRVFEDTHCLEDLLVRQAIENGYEDEVPRP